jgi:HEAT repeat protein
LSSTALAKSNPPDQCDQFRAAPRGAYEQGLQSPEARERITAILCLPKAHPGAARLIERALGDPSPPVRRAAAARAVDISPRVLGRFGADPDPYVRVQSFQVRRDPAAVTAVIDLLQKGLDAYTSLPWAGTSALAAFEGVPTEPVDLGGGPRGWLREWAPGTQVSGAARLAALLEMQVNWLGSRHDQRAIAPLLRVLALQVGPDPGRLPEAAASSLFALIYPDRNTPAARAAVVPLTGFVATAGMNSSARRSVVYLLEKWKAPESVPLLVEMLHHPDTEARDDAVGLLGSLRAKEAIGPLMELLEDSALENVPEALAKLAPESIPPLTDALRSTAARARGAAEALRLIGPNARAAVPPLLKMAAHDDPNDCSGLRALAAIEPASPRTVDVFLTFLGSEGECLNWSIADLAKKIRPVPRDAVARLRALVHSPLARVRQSAAIVLGAFGPAARAASGDLGLSLDDYRRTPDYEYDGDYDLSLGEAHRSAVRAIQRIGIDDRTKGTLIRRRDAACRTGTSPSECDATRNAIVRALVRTP